ncbi:hypothetical protein ASPZODRAFT_129586 [Penicilliopsis zonata CBS 506.65]|uniref:Peptidase S54 rhomboid domain-containing protein n=1 Tax=Penicilliopsis zonata CBS 506.65 TaxID=1073090 RepID=A0A1L9SQ26_9EURO|nr:hypothetical protein ASPZODRAFT_129586 [Penicilliopsis zonata CBS 506.65]OJJ49177.1 hypothetical protein ASPZODRAFT_129586 [Penicilliopsis zonata CBS 506.65]
MPLRVNLPPATRAFLFALLALSLLYNIARWRQLEPPKAGEPLETPIIPYLTLVPSLVIYFPWTLLTATFVEQNIFTVLLNGATLFYGGKYLERAWGSREFGKFILLVALIPSLCILPLYLLWGGITADTARGLTQICGGVSIQASFLVAFKQLVPEHTVAVYKGFIKMRVKHFPALFLLLNTLSGLLIGTDTAAVLAWLGLLTSWTYLRFYKRQPDLTGTATGGLGIKGDPSETFTFACLFPDVIQPPIAFVADQIYALLVAIKLCTPFSEEDIASGNQQALARGEAGLPNLLSIGRPGGGSSGAGVGAGVRGSGKREEAERRRALALRALDQRLQAASSAAASRVQPAPHLSTTTSPQPRPTTPTVSSGQAMLGETSYIPEE